MARITERKIPKINELYNSESDISVGAKEYDESNTSVDYKELLNKDFDFEIEEGNNEVVVKQGFGEEVEHLVKTKSKEPKEKVISKIISNENKINFDDCSTLIIKIPKVNKTGISSNEIKIPSTIFNSLNALFEYPNSYHMEEDEKGKLREVGKFVIDVFENETKELFENIDAKIIVGEKTTSIWANEFEKINIDDDDILRLIKLENGKYRLEIIKLTSSEYSIWDAFCTNQIKGTQKKFGVS